MATITCPACQTKYQVPEAALGEGGRRVSCAKCSNVWLAKADMPVAAPPVEPVAPEPVVSDPVASVPEPSERVSPVAAPPEMDRSEVEQPEAASPEIAPAEPERPVSVPPAAQPVAASPEMDERPGPANDDAFAEGEAADSGDADEGGVDEGGWSDERVARFPSPHAGFEDRPQADGPDIYRRDAEPFVDMPESSSADEPEPDAEDDGESWSAQPPSVDAAAERIRQERAKQLAEIREIVNEVQTGAGANLAGAPAAPDPIGKAAASLERPQVKPDPAEEQAAASDGGTLSSLRSLLRGSKAKEAPAPAKPGPAAMPAAMAAASGVAEFAPPSRPEPARTQRPRPAEERDPLRERLVPSTNRPTAQSTEQNRKAMMRKHSRRVRKRVERDKRGNGLFWTGFLLCLIVGCVLVALYNLNETIAAEVPELAPALDQYVAFVDEARLTVTAKAAELREMVLALIEGGE